MRDWLGGTTSPAPEAQGSFSFAPVTINDRQILDRANRLLIVYNGFRLSEGRFETRIFRQPAGDLTPDPGGNPGWISVGEGSCTLSMSIDHLRDQPIGYANHDREVLVHLPYVTYDLDFWLSPLQRSFALSSRADSLKLFLLCLVEQLHLAAWDEDFDPKLGILRSYVDASALRLMIDPSLRALAERLLGKDEADYILREERLVRPVTRPKAEPLKLLQ